MSGFLGSLPNAKESTAFALLSFFLYWLQKLAAYSQIWKVRNKPFKILNTSQFSVLTFFRFSSQFSTACLKLLFASVFRGIPCHPSSKPRLLLSPFRSQSPLFLHISVSDSQVWEPVYFVFIIRSFVFFFRDVCLNAENHETEKACTWETASTNTLLPSLFATLGRLLHARQPALPLS